MPVAADMVSTSVVGGRQRAVRFAHGNVTPTLASATMTMGRTTPTPPPPPPPTPTPRSTQQSHQSCHTKPTGSYKGPAVASIASTTGGMTVVGAGKTGETPTHRMVQPPPPPPPPPPRKVLIDYSLVPMTAARSSSSLKHEPTNPTPREVHFVPPSPSTTTTTKATTPNDVHVDIQTVTVTPVPETDISALSSSPSPMKRSSSASAIPLMKTTTLPTTSSAAMKAQQTHIVPKTNSSGSGAITSPRRSRSLSPSPVRPPPPPPPPAQQIASSAGKSVSRLHKSSQMNARSSMRSPSPPPPPPPRRPGQSNIVNKTSSCGAVEQASSKAPQSPATVAQRLVLRNMNRSISPVVPPPPPPPPPPQQTQTKDLVRDRSGVVESSNHIPSNVKHPQRRKVTVPPPLPPQNAAKQSTKTVHFSVNPPSQIPFDGAASTESSIGCEDNIVGKSTRGKHFDYSAESRELAQSTNNISLISKGDDPTMDSLPMATHLLDDDADYNLKHRDVTSNQRGLNADTNTLNLSISQDNEHSSSILDGEFLVDTPSASVLENSFGTTSANKVSPKGESLQTDKATPSLAYSVSVGGRTEVANQAHIDLASITLSKVEKERLVRAFQAKLDTVNIEKTKLKLEFEKIQQQYDSTKLQLRLSQKDQMEKEQEALTKIAEFQSRLTHSRLQVVGERTKRTQCEQELQMQNSKNNQLRKDLEDTEEKLKFCQHQYSQLKVDLLKATRTHQIEPATISPQGFVAALSEKVKTLSEANSRMSKIIDDAYKAIRARDCLERQLKGAVETKERLEKENLRLVKDCEELKKEVKDSQKYIDQLLKTSNDTKKEEWEIREQQYKRAIYNLNQRILQQGTVVSFSVYKDEVEEGKRKNEALQHCVHDLKRQISKLQQEKDVMSRVFSPRMKPMTVSKKKSTANPQNLKLSSSESLNPTNEKDGFRQKIPHSTLNSSAQNMSLSPEANVSALRHECSQKMTSNQKVLVKERNVKTIVVETETAPATDSNRQVPIKIVTCTNSKEGTSNWWEDKENNVEKKTPGKQFSASSSSQQPKGLRQSPLEKVRQLGGRLALKKKLDTCRSPRQVQTIIHY